MPQRLHLPYFWRPTLALLLVLLFSLPVVVHAAERRVALVMGNGAYAGSAKLKNAVADAKLMARTLEGLGFKVTLLTDVQTEQDMKRALVQFKRSLPDAEVGLVYFSGHGVQTERGNYLLPVQGDYQREADFDSQAVRLSDVLEQFRGSRAAGLVILDACRDNPFRSSTRSATRGLRREEPPNGLLIAYSTAQNQTAADGVGGNGLYTKHLAHFLSQKGLSVDEVFDQTAKQVKLESRGEQSPREDSDIREKLFLNGAPVVAVAPATLPAPAAAGDDGLEAQAWRDAQLLDTPAAYETFATAYPGSRYAGAARLKLDIARKREQQQAEVAQREAHAAELRERAQSEARAWQEAQAADTAEGYRAFIDTYPQSPNLKAAQRKLAAAEKTEAAEQAKRVAEAWRTAQQADTVEAYEAFLNAHTSSSFAAQARQKLEAARARQPKYTVGDTFRDCAECPEMVVLPAGNFEMGDLHGDGDKDEKPVRTVRIPQAFAMGKYEVTVGEFRRFVTESGYRTDAERNTGGDHGCYSLDKLSDRSFTWQWGWRQSRDWQKTISYLTEDHPVTCISWNDAQAYIRWLAQKSGQRFRLPSEAEFEYAQRAGGTTKWPWGEDSSEACQYSNVADQTYEPGIGSWKDAHECRDGSFFVASASRFTLANPFGLHDLSGNVSEWVQDCYEENYERGQPVDGRAHEPGANCRRVVRGGNWSTGKPAARSAKRIIGTSGFRADFLGFRLSRTLP
jgi:formylglycine-generating enzyme required for sulfatase activity